MSSESSEIRPRRRGLAASSCYEDTFRDQYAVLGVIGQGAFAQVKLARHLLTGTEVAVKILPKSAGTLHLITSELDLMKSLQHPNVVQLFQVMETREHVYLVMEFVSGGRLLRRIPRAGGMQEAEARRVFRQVVSALRYCHGRGIVHRDLKPDNILLDVAGNVKVCDFGLGDRFRPGQKLSKVCGTFVYSAPELYRQEAYDGPAVDIWSLGVTLYYMLMGGLPFKGKTYSQLKKQVLSLNYAPPSHVSAEARSLIGMLLSMDPAQRPTVEQILAHPWLSQGQEDSPRHPRGPLPTLPNPTILRTMLEMGFNIHDTLVSLEERKFDGNLATYLILQYQMSQGSHIQAAHRPRLCPAPPPPKERASEPTRLLPQEGQQSGLKGGIGASLPVIALCSLKTTPLTPCHALQHVPEPPTSSPCTGSHVEEPESSKSCQDTPSKANWLSSGPPPEGTAACALADRWDWRKVTRTLGKWLWKCSCVTAPKTGPAFRTKVSPVKAGQKRPGFFRRKLIPMRPRDS